MGGNVGLTLVRRSLKFLSVYDEFFVYKARQAMGDSAHFSPSILPMSVLHGQILPSASWRWRQGMGMDLRDDDKSYPPPPASCAGGGVCRCRRLMS